MGEDVDVEAGFVDSFDEGVAEFFTGRLHTVVSRAITIQNSNVL